MRRVTAAVLLAIALSLVSVASALGHVHGITPLSCLDTDNAARSGALNAQGGPIAGFIPASVGNAPLVPFAGGGTAAAPCQ